MLIYLHFVLYGFCLLNGTLSVFLVSSAISCALASQKNVSLSRAA